MDHNEAFQTSFSSSGSRKEKKKQVKDEVDRLRQAEKKKRRLEKALATSAAIRSELEKKKQKKKEEQQRLDEEVAAIAEAVALHVLADEDSEETTKVVLKKNENIGLWQGPYFGLLPENLMVSDGNIEFYLGRQRKDALYQNSPHCYGDGSYYIGSESRGSFSGPSGTEWEHINWKLPHGREIERTNGYPELNGREFVFENGWSRWKNFCLVNQKRMACDAKARAAEVPAGLAAAQAVAALRIAEEARAEAEAANIVAETAITRILDKIT